MSGDYAAHFDKLAPGDSVDYSFVISPQFSTPKELYEYKPAMVTYMYGEEDEQAEAMATSSRPHTRVPNQRILDGRTYVLSSQDYLAQTAMYFREWITFALLAIGPVLGPLGFYLFLKKSTDAILKKSN